MLEFCSGLPGYGVNDPDKEAYPEWHWWFTLLTGNKWLTDSHMRSWVIMMSKRLANNPEWFKNDRICFLDSRITQFWERDWPKFQRCEMLPPNSLDWFYGNLPKSHPTGKRWGYDVDDLYIPLNINMKHWVALHVSIPNRHITIYDSLPTYVNDATMGLLVEPYAVMMPHLMNAACLEEDKPKYFTTKYTHDRPSKVPHQRGDGDCGVFVLKFIECLALGHTTFPNTLSQTNCHLFREQIAADLYHEINCRGPVEDPEDFDNIDLYDSTI
uniref:Sentrin-specific protease 5 n=1 Tax=Noccaea caerulescens TaxID=107243 RepID=A0A1J3J155_NOCCA